MGNVAPRLREGLIAVVHSSAGVDSAKGGRNVLGDAGDCGSTGTAGLPSASPASPASLGEKGVPAGYAVHVNQDSRPCCGEQ